METLTIKKVKQETEDSKSFFIDPSSENLDWSAKAGQYITVEVEVNGEKCRRSYSLSSAPFDEMMAFTIKRVKGGKVSNFMIDHIKEGSKLQMLSPDGKFVLLPDPNERRDYYFFAAGSGITPVMSMIRTLLENEPKSSAYLLYGNRSESDIIFKAELDQLCDTYRDQLYVEHTLSKPQREKKSGIGGLFSRGTVHWKGWKGRVDEEKILRFMNEYQSKSGRDRFFICGPGNFIEYTRQVLIGEGYDKSLIKSELFTTPDSVEGSSPAVLSSGSHALKVLLEGQNIELEHDNALTVLETLIKAGHDAPYSCTSGACSTCVAKIKSGTVAMDACFALDDDEIAEGYILTCQARVTSPSLEIEFED